MNNKKLVQPKTNNKTLKTVQAQPKVSKPKAINNTKNPSKTPTKEQKEDQNKNNNQTNNSNQNNQNNNNNNNQNNNNNNQKQETAQQKKSPIPKTKTIKKQPIKKIEKSNLKKATPVQNNKTNDNKNNNNNNKNMKPATQAAKKTLFLITGNKNKLIEFQQILSSTNFNLESQNVDLPEYQGKDTDIAKQKALLAFQKSGKKPVLTEDTSLIFNAYKGLPGPYVKWFLDAIKPEGLHNMLAGFDDKTGYAQCIITYMSKELKEPLCFVGQTPGTIVKPRGDNAFGWDPIFQPDGYDKTYAELPKEEKNKISHRFRAIEKMLEYFNKQQ